LISPGKPGDTKISPPKNISPLSFKAAVIFHTLLTSSNTGGAAVFEKVITDGGNCICVVEPGAEIVPSSTLITVFALIFPDTFKFALNQMLLLLQ
jgi:hypothetical protein